MISRHQTGEAAATESRNVSFHCDMPSSNA